VSVDILDILTPAPPFDLGEESHACIDIIGVLLVSPPFGCLGDGPFDVHSCIDIIGVLHVAPPFACYISGEIVAEMGIDCVTSLSLTADALAEVGAGCNDRGVVNGNGDWPPYGGIASIPNQRFLEVGTMFILCQAEEGRIVDRVLAATAWKPTEIEVQLFTNDIEPTPATVLADLTEATFDGYASLDTVDMHAKSLSNDGHYETIAKTTQQFVCTGDTTPETVYGYMVLDFAGNLIGAERVGSTWITVPGLPDVDLICDPEEEGKGLLKDALVALIERL